MDGITACVEARLPTGFPGGGSSMGATGIDRAIRLLGLRVEVPGGLVKPWTTFRCQSHLFSRCLADASHSDALSRSACGRDKGADLRAGSLRCRSAESEIKRLAGLTASVSLRVSSDETQVKRLHA